MVACCKLREWLNDCLDSPRVKFYETLTVGVTDCCSKAIIDLCYDSKEHLGKIYMMCFLVVSETFVIIFNLLASFLLTFWQSKNLQIQTPKVNPVFSHSFLPNNCL